MTRKDYELITDVLKDTLEFYNELGSPVMARGAEQVAYNLAKALSKDNKAFDKDKFINDIRGQ